MASAGAIFSRAALFRPGIVGAWTYPFLLFAVLPLTLGAVAAAARRAPPSGRLVRRARAHAAPRPRDRAGGVPNAGSWALITPAFNAPDEPDHFAYAQYFAETGHAPPRLPDSRPSYSTEQTLALNAVNVYSQVSHPDGRPPWLAVGADARGSTKSPRRRTRRTTAAASPRRPRPTSPPTTPCSRPPTSRCARSRRSRS